VSKTNQSNLKTLFSFFKKGRGFIWRLIATFSPNDLTESIVMKNK